MALRGVRPRRLLFGAVAAVTLAAVTAVAMVLWPTAGPAAGVRVLQSSPSGAAGDQARAYALGLLAKLELPRGTRPAELRGQGIAPRALNAFLAWAVEHIDLRAAHLACHVDNLASRRVAEKCGFALVGREGDEHQFQRGLDT